MKTFLLFPFTLMGILLMSSFGQAQVLQTCSLSQGSHAAYEQSTDQTPVIEVHLTEDALRYFRQQFYLPGFLNQILKQSCGWGEALASQLAFILSHVMASSQEPVLDIRVLVDEQLSPYTSGTRTATIWVQGVEQKIPLPVLSSTVRRIHAAHDPYTRIDVTLPEVIGATYFALAQLHDGGQPYELVKTLRAESQAGATIHYRLTLELKRGGETEIHEIVVTSQPWIGAWDFISDKISAKVTL